MYQPRIVSREIFRTRGDLHSNITYEESLGFKDVHQYRTYTSAKSTSGILGIECGEWSEWKDVPHAGREDALDD